MGGAEGIPALMMIPNEVGLRPVMMDLLRSCSLEVKNGHQAAITMLVIKLQR